MMRYLRYWAVVMICMLSIVDHAEAEEITIGVLKWATHPALDEVETAFVEELGRLAVVELPGIELVFQRRNAGASLNKAMDIAQSAARSHFDMVVTFGTPATQAASRTIDSIPILFAAVSDPEGAGITPAKNVTGIKNVGPEIIAKALAFIKAVIPDCKSVGTIYNPAEQNSVYVQQLMRYECERLGLELVQRRLTDPTQITSTADALTRHVDVLYSANDNAVNMGISAVSSVARERKVMFVIGEVSVLSNGPAVAIGVNYTTTGQRLAAVAIRVLKGENPGDIPVEQPKDVEIRVNEDVVRDIGLVDAIANAVAERANR